MVKMRKIIFCLLLHIPALLRGANYYVSTTGVDDASRNGMSQSQAWKTLYYASTRATSSGDIINVSAGTYAADSRLIELRSGVSVKGAGRESTILVLTNTSENCCLKLDSWNGWGSTSYGNQHISGIKFDGDLTAASAIGVVGRSNVYVYDCEFIDFVNSAVFFSGQPSYTWTLQNIYSTKTNGDHSKMPDSNAWCSGNKAYNNIMTNCSRMADTEHHGGALRFGTQDGFEAYGNTINSLDRRGFGIKFYDLGWNKNTNIHDNDVEVSPILSGMRYDFAIELWWELGGCKVYNNRLKGSLDLVHSVDHINAGYSMQIYGNNIGRSDAIPTTNDRGIVLEGRIEYVEVYRNYIHNVTRAFYIPRELNGGFSGVDRIYYTKIYDNLCVNLGWEQASRMWGIYFLPQDQTVNQDETQYFYVQNNTWTIHPDITVNTWCGLMLPNVSQMSNVYYDNNIIVGFDRGGIVAEYARTKADNIFIRKNLIYDCGNNNQPYYDAAFNSSLTNYTFVAGPTTSPQFVSSTDFHLQSSSPAIGQGVNVGLLTDYDGNYWKTPPSIGCYEYYASTPPPSLHTYYVKNGGNDNADGLSDATAWATIAKVNSFTFTPGDTILFRRGDIWHEQRSLIPQSGNNSAYMVYGAYGVGNKPQILGSKQENSTSDWTNVGTNLWRNTDSNFNNSNGGVGNLIFNNEAIIGHKVYSSSDLTAQGRFYYDLTNQHLTLYSTSNPASYYTNIECALGKDAVRLWNSQDNVIIENLDFRYWAAHGISAGGGNDNIIIRDCHFRYIGGGDFDGGSYGNAVQFWASHSNVLIERNTFYQIYDAAITPQYSGSAAVNVNNFVVRLNIIEKAYWSFEYFCSTSTASTINGIYFQNNTCVDAGNSWSNAQRPLDQNEGRHLQLWSYDTDVSLSNFYIRNNIFSKATETAIRVGQTLAPLITFDYNLYDVDVMAYDWNTYTSLSQWQAAYSKDAHSISDDPEFLSSSDFHLASTSPAIAAGYNVGYTYDFDLENFLAPPSIGAYEYITGGEPPEEPEPGTIIWKYARKAGKFLMKKGQKVKRPVLIPPE